MDTFKKYDYENYTLYNYSDFSLDVLYHTLIDTDGRYSEYEDEEEGDYSEYYDTFISEDESVYSEPLQDYIYLEDSVLVDIGSDERLGHYPSEFSEIVYDSWLGEYIHIDDATYNEILGEYFFTEHSIDVIYRFNNIDNYSVHTFSKYDSNVIKIADLESYEYIKEHIKEQYIHKDTLNYSHGKFYLKELSMWTYQLNDGKFYSEIDCFIYDIETASSSSSKVSDEYSYNYNLENKKEILDKCNLRIKSGSKLQSDIRIKLNDRKLELIKYLKLN